MPPRLWRCIKPFANELQVRIKVASRCPAFTPPLDRIVTLPPQYVELWKHQGKAWNSLSALSSQPSDDLSGLGVEDSRIKGGDPSRRL